MSYKRTRESNDLQHIRYILSLPSKQKLAYHFGYILEEECRGDDETEPSSYPWSEFTSLHGINDMVNFAHELVVTIPTAKRRKGEKEESFREDIVEHITDEGGWRALMERIYNIFDEIERNEFGEVVLQFHVQPNRHATSLYTQSLGQDSVQDVIRRYRDIGAVDELLKGVKAHKDEAVVDLLERVADAIASSVSLQESKARFAGETDEIRAAVGKLINRAKSLVQTPSISGTLSDNDTAA